MSKSTFVFTFFFLVLSGSILGQTKAIKKPLSQILEILEAQHQVTFSYIDEDVKNVEVSIRVEKISGKAEILSLEETLSIIESQVPLRFIILEDSIIIQKYVAVNYNNQTLDEVLITQYLASGITLNTNGSVTISPKEFKVIPGLSEPDVLASVKSLPGISSTDESVTNLNIRGGTNDQNLILWDGIKMYQSGHFFGMISAFDPYGIDHINVVKNGSSARLGDGVSGTVEMVLDAQQDSLEANAGFNLLSASGFLKTTLTNNVSFQLLARRSITDVVETPTFSQYFDRVFQDTEVTDNSTAVNRAIMNNQAFYFYDVSGKLVFDISEKDKVSASFITINNEFNFLEQAESLERNQALESGLKQQNNAASLKYHRAWNSRLSTDVSGYVSNYKLSGVNFDIINNQRLDQFNEVLDINLKVDALCLISKNQSLKGGYHFTETGVTNAVNVNAPPLFNFKREVLISHAGYAEYSQSSKKSNISFGVRATNYPKFSNTFIEPRLNASFQMGTYFRAHLMGELKHQATSQIIQQSDDFLGIVKRRWVLANDDDVAFNESQQASLGSSYNYNNWLVSVEGYYKRVTGVNSRSQGFRNQFQFTNTNGEYRIKGVDFLIQKRYNSWRSWLGYSLSENTYTFEELNDGVPFSNNVDTRHSITFNNSYAYKKLRAAIGFNWHTGIPTTTVLGESLSSSTPLSARELQFNAPNGERLESFFRTDVAINYSFKISEKIKGTTGVAIWNILNQKQTIDQYYANVNGEATQFEQESLGFTPNVSMRLFF